MIDLKTIRNEIDLIVQGFNVYTTGELRKDIEGLGPVMIVADVNNQNAFLAKGILCFTVAELRAISLMPDMQLASSLEWRIKQITKEG